jgi:hypothetical protein
MKPPHLTEKQKEVLGRLEPALRKAVRLGDYPTAKRITSDIQAILRPTGHETRLMQAKNWLFEAALEAGEVDTAISGFVGIRRKMARHTRGYLEATALLAVCYLRKGEFELAQPCMAEVLKNESLIKSPRRRREFKFNVIQRFEEEAALASFRGKYNEKLSAEEIQNEAGQLVQAETEDEMFTRVGKFSPPETKFVILRIEQFSRNQLPKGDLKFLPNPEDRVKDETVGRTVFLSVRRVLWKSLCDPESDIYKAWVHKGLGIVLNRLYIGTAVTTILADLGIGIKAIAVPVAALLIKFGIEVYCDRFKPTGVMIEK